MEFNILHLYRVLLAIYIFLVVKKIVFIARKPKNISYYSTYLFSLVAVLGFLCNIDLMLIAEFCEPPVTSFETMEINGRIVFLVILFIAIMLTYVLFLLSRKYATYNLIYVKGNKKINLEESYIILHKLFKDVKIHLNDIVPEESCYCLVTPKKSKIFLYASILGGNEYADLRLKNGKRIKIANNSVILQGSRLTWFSLKRALKIETKHKTCKF